MSRKKDPKAESAAQKAGVDETTAKQAAGKGGAPGGDRPARGRGGPIRF